MRTICTTIVLFLIITFNSKSDVFKMNLGSSIEISSKSEIHFDFEDNYDSLNLEMYNPFKKEWESLTIDTIINDVLFTNLSKYKSSDYYKFKLRIFNESEKKEVYSDPMIRLKSDLKKIIVNKPMQYKIESDSFKIYPNPVKDKTINIVSERSNAEVQSIKLIDMTGLTLFEVNNLEISGKYNMHLPNITKGAYIVQISTADDVETKKIIIE